MPYPEIFVIAGPNGAGKSTGAASILPKRFPTDRFINADDIAKVLAINSPLEAGRIMLQRLHDLRNRGDTFAFETTLAGRSYERFLREAQQSGYRVHLAYVWLSSVELAKKRVAVRVQRGGHDIPPSDIERRYWRGLRNCFELYQPLANAWVLCDNSGMKLVVVARQRQGHELEILDENRYNRIRYASTSRNK